MSTSDIIAENHTEQRENILCCLATNQRVPEVHNAYRVQRQVEGRQLRNSQTLAPQGFYKYSQVSALLSQTTTSSSNKVSRLI